MDFLHWVLMAGANHDCAEREIGRSENDAIMAKCYHKNNDSKKKNRLVTVSDRDSASAKRRE